MKKSNKRTIFVTGGCGFIGSHFIRYWLTRYPNDTVVNFDALTYAGLKQNLSDVESDPHYALVRGDITDTRSVERAIASYKPTHLINFAAETHVDRSVHGGAGDFVRTNVHGVQVLLDATKHLPIRSLFVSTDEVYGSLPLKGGRRFTESTPLSPRSPYSASKTSGDLLVLAYHETYGTDATVTRCSNNYGPNQYPEKLIPFFTLKALADKPLPLYGDGLNVRDWIHVLDHVEALARVLLKGKSGSVFNIGGDHELSNRAITEAILTSLEKPVSLISYVGDRPGHDRRYAINASHIKKSLGWKSRQKFGIMLPQTVRWYAENPQWVQSALKRVQSVNSHIQI